MTYTVRSKVTEPDGEVFLLEYEQKGESKDAVMKDYHTRMGELLAPDQKYEFLSIKEALA